MTSGTRNETLLVPVANPETAARLLDTAIDIAHGRSMRIVVLHVVEVPPQVPLSAGDSLIGDDGEEVQFLDDAVERVTDAGVAVESRIRYARDVATGIVGAVDAYDADGLLVGWRGRPRRRDVILGSFLDRILAEAPCDVFVKRIRTPSRDIDSVLVPVAGAHTVNWPSNSPVRSHHSATRWYVFSTFTTPTYATRRVTPPRRFSKTTNRSSPVRMSTWSRRPFGVNTLQAQSQTNRRDSTSLFWARHESRFSAGNSSVRSPKASDGRRRVPLS